MINILHSIDTPGPGGAERIFLDVALGTHRMPGINSIAIVPKQGWLFERLANNGISPIVVDSKASFSLRYLKNILSIVRRYHIHIIQSHLLGSNVYCCLVGMITRKPVISTFHGFVDANPKDPLLKIKISIVNYYSRKIVFVSDHLRSHYITKCGIKSYKTNVIPNGIDEHKYRPGKSEILRSELGLKSTDIIVGSVGNIRPAKGYDVLVRAALRVKRKRKDIKFVIVGAKNDPSYKKLLLMSKQLNVQDTVFFIGYRENIPELLRGMDIFLLPSKLEGFSVATLEAMLTGLNVIATRSGGPEEILSRLQTGVLINAGSEVEMAYAVLKMAQRRRREVGRGEGAIRDLILRHYSKERMVKRYLAVYREVLNKEENQRGRNWDHSETV